jgi:hypothetical protein
VIDVDVTAVPDPEFAVGAGDVNTVIVSFPAPGDHSSIATAFADDELPHVIVTSSPFVYALATFTSAANAVVPSNATPDVRFAVSGTTVHDPFRASATAIVVAIPDAPVLSTAPRMIR